MIWTSYSIVKHWPKCATIRPPRERNIKTIVDDLRVVKITTYKNKKYELGVKVIGTEILYIKSFKKNTKEFKFWSIWKCFKCFEFIDKQLHILYEFYEFDICLICLGALITEAKQKAKLHVIPKRKSRKILL